ncbi:unnamed protein product [Arabidopsis thaliana]|uniref:Mitochondrial import inner membrane translocase subunit TIM50 n=1 Tax=Arabidopsis thaliana TaxID=3702 RepID=Q9FL21_ARATH|nr:unnamed protein product [Arabidopsis thaliana]
MKSKISKVLGVCKKHKASTRNSCSLSKISGDLESITAAITTCHDDEKQHPGLDTFSRESETNEPAEMLVEDTSQSQGFAPWVDGSQSVENMENACNHMSNSDTIFSPVLNDELDGTGRDTDKINLDNHDLFLAFNRTRSYNVEPDDRAESEVAEDFDPQLFIKNQPELSDVVSNYWPRDTLRKKSVTLVLDLDDILDPDGKFISQRFYRDSCILLDGIYTKDLTVLGLDLAKVAIIDNCPQVYRLQINNGIPIKSWYDDPTDDGLITILPFLETLAVADDVRPIIGRRFGNKE